MSWSTSKLCDIANIERSQIDPGQISPGTKYLGLEHIEAGGRILGAQSVSKGDLKSAKFIFGAEHLLYGKLRPYLAKISLPDFEGICSTDILPIRPGPSLDRKFLAYYLLQPQVVQEAASHATGANLPRLSPKALAEIYIPQPPIEEQRRIAAILDKADAIRRKREQALELADEFLKSVFLEMFRGDKWSAKPLAEVVSKGSVVTYGIVQAGPEYEGGVPYIRTGDIKKGKIVLDNLRHTSSEIAVKFGRSTVRVGEIVMSIRATVGTTALVPRELDGANLTQGTARISPGEMVTTEYLLHFLRSQRCQDWINRQVKGATFREITLSRLREMEVSIPPLKLQQKFSKLTKSTSAMADRIKTDLEQSENLFGSLSQDAFRGEL